MAYKLLLPPDQASYSVVDGTEVIRQELDGGLGRYRRDIIGASRVVNCQWTVDRNNYQYLRSFYKIVSSLSEAFKIDLYLDSPYLTEHDAHFIPGSMRLSAQQGHTFTVTCQLEAEPLDTEEFDNAYVDIISAFGSPEEAVLAFNFLEKLVNVDLPKINSVYVPPEEIIYLTDTDGNTYVDENGYVLAGFLDE